MAFAGHARSLNLSCTSPSLAYIANIHPDRHHHILPEQTSPKRANHASPHSSKNYLSQQEPNKEGHGRSQGDDIPPNKVSFNDAVVSGTDDMGNTPTKSLWIGNVPSGLMDNDLHNAFKKYGHILSVRATPSKRCGFVNFEMVESAMQAWRACHEYDMFDTGVPIYVRYEKPPSWLKDKHPSLKRKRSANILASPAEDSVKKKVPTGPRSQVLHGIPPIGPKLVQNSMSPPPLRRHDTYRPCDLSEEDWPPKKVGERYREDDLYRPFYDNGSEALQIDKRSSVTAREEPLLQNHINVKGSPGGHPRPAHTNQARSPSLSASSLQSTNRENAALSLGIGIKGLAASRRESSNDDGRSGLSIKGSASQNKVALSTVSATSTLRNVISSQDSLPNVNKPFLANHSRRLRSLSLEQAQVEPGSLKADTGRKHRVLRHDASLLDSTPSLKTPVIVNEIMSRKSLSNGQNHPQDEIIQDKTLSVREPKHGFPNLTQLIVLKEIEDKAHKKARTISPFGRVRASSRATTSVESAKTDPTPVHKRPPDLCDTCKVGDHLYKLFKCAVPSCFRRTHELCGSSVSNTDSASFDQRTKVICHKCSYDDHEAFEKVLPAGLVTKVGARNKNNTAADDVEKVVTPPESKNMQCDNREISYSFVSIGSAKIAANGSSGRIVALQDAHATSFKKTSQVVVKAPDSRLGPEKKIASDKEQKQKPDDGRPVSVPSTQPNNPPPPTEPRLMRDGEVDEQALEISVRYKKAVTCPWWRKGDKCVRHPKDCMFAHHWTGVESPNGRSVAKDWTCFDYRTSLGCRRSEKDCLYSHKDTGLYVGLDGKASKKHLECYWWWYNGRCTFSDSSCTCAHYSTGIVAEEPMPRDTMRRATQQSLTASSQDADTNMDLQTKSPSYSPPPPPTASSDSLFVAQWPLQHCSDETMNPLQGQDDQINPRLNPHRQTETGVDPRLKRNIDLAPRSEQHNLLARSTSARTAAPNHNQKTDFDDSNSPTADAYVAPLKSKQRAMNACKNCSKKIFKAEICTDCIKLGQRKDSEQTGTNEYVTDQAKMNGSSDEHVSKDTTVFAIPAPKVLKRSRTGSSFNLFASKRMRPDMTTIRSSVQSSATSSGVKFKNPPSLEQLNRANAKKRAKEDAQAVRDSDRPNIETSADQEYAVSPSVPLGRAPTFSPSTALESPIAVSQNSSNFADDVLMSNHPVTVGKVQNDTIEVLHEAYGKSEPHQSQTDSLTSRRNSDTPLAEIRSRGDKLLWYSSTSNQSPQESRSALKVTTSGVTATISRHSGHAVSGPRCRTCIKYHRKCVHNDTSGKFEDYKCYAWQQDRIRLNITHNAHYAGAEREEILRRANRHAATLLAVCEASDNDSDKNESVESDEEDLRSSSSDEIQRPHIKSSVTTYQGPTSRTLADTTEEGSRSSTPETRPSAHGTSLPDSKKAGSYTQNAALLEEQERANIIARLKAKGAVFEDSDSADDMDDIDVQLNIDNRSDPLLYHKQQNADRGPPLDLPSITKGQGLKDAQRIQHRQMTRNFTMFRNAHKEVDRKIPHQAVSALVEKKDPDDVLAPPQEFENKITFQEFLGLRKDKAVESCLGKVPIGRGKCIQGLAFREKEIDPGLGAWGREKRGNRKEKLVYTVGL